MLAPALLVRSHRLSNPRRLLVRDAVNRLWRGGRWRLSRAALPSADISCTYVSPADPMYIGAILSAQYTGVVIGSIFWARLSDFMGIRRIYLVLLVQDFILFALSAVMTSALGMLIVG